MPHGLHAAALRRRGARSTGRRLRHRHRDLPLDAERSQRLVNTLGPLPEQFTEAGVDHRLAVIRFGTGRLRQGPDRPEVLLDFTTDAADYRGKIDMLQTKLTGPSESGSEAFTLALDSLSFRPNAIPVFLLFTDENDDLPISMERAGREPPGRSWLSSPRRDLFQARMDEVARRLVDLHARVVMLVNPRSPPTEFQYGSPRATVIDGDGSGRLRKPCA